MMKENNWGKERIGSWEQRLDEVREKLTSVGAFKTGIFNAIPQEENVKIRIFQKKKGRAKKSLIITKRE